MKMKAKKNLLLTAITMGLSFGAQAQVSGGVVKIGVLTDLSGTYSDLAGQGSITAARMAIDDFIAKEKPDFKIEMVTADHRNKADIGSAKAREWFDQEGVDMITDVTNTPVTLAVMKVAEEKKRLVMEMGSASTLITNENCNAYTVDYVYDTYALANGTARTVTQQGGKSWFFLTVDYAFGHSLEKDSTAVIEANGGKVLGSVRHPFPTSDFSSFLLRAQASGAQVIGLANAGADTINAVRQAGEFGITQQQSLAGLLIFLSDIHSLGLQSTQGMYLTTGFYWDRNEETRAWSKRFFEKQQRMPTMAQAGNYSGVYHYLQAVKALGSDDADAVMAQMKKTPINDFFAQGGLIRDDGRMVHDMYLVQVKSPAESKYPWDYYTVKATIPGAEAFQPLSESRCHLIKK